MHSLIIPKDVAEAFLQPDRNRVQITATFLDRQVHFHAALQKGDQGDYRITFGKQLQKQLGVFKNDFFTIELKPDQSKYGVEIPEELEAVLLTDLEAYDRFESLTPGRQRSIIYSIRRYKSPQTRVDKSLIVCENLKRGITDLKLLFKVA